ncbi:MAG: PRC-barrel domain-containing protein [Phycisphaerales bacterium]
MCCKAKMCAVIFLFIVGSAIAATEEKQSRMSSGMTGSMSAKTNVLQSANKIMGADVKNNNNEKLGTVKELIVNQNKDNIEYIIVSGEDMLHPVPFTAIKCQSGEDVNKPTDSNAAAEEKTTRLTLNMSKDQFHSAPTIDSIDTTALSSSSLKQKIDSFYSSQMQESESMWNKMKTEVKERMPQGMKERMGTETEKEGQTANLLKASDLIGIDVKNLKDEQLASIKDIVIDTRKGNLAYGLLGFGGVLGVREKVAAVPWSALAIQPDHSVAKLDATQDKLESATLPEGRIAQLNQREFAQRVHEVFGVEPYWQVYGFEAPGESGTRQRESDDQMREQMKKEMKERREEYKQEHKGSSY